MENYRLRYELATAGFTNLDVADELGVDPKTVERWVTQGRLPYPRHRIRLARLLGCSEPDLWPTASTNRDDPDSGDENLGLSGDWWAARQTRHDGIEMIVLCPVRLWHAEGIVEMQADRVPGNPASYRWHAELRCHHASALAGWYASAERQIRANGALYLRLHPHGEHAVGRWIGEAHDGPIGAGWMTLADTASSAEATLRHLANHGLGRLLYGATPSATDGHKRRLRLFPLHRTQTPSPSASSPQPVTPTAGDRIVDGDASRPPTLRSDGSFADPFGDHEPNGEEELTWP